MSDEEQVYQGKHRADATSGPLSGKISDRIRTDKEALNRENRPE